MVSPNIFVVFLAERIVFLLQQNFKDSYLFLQEFHTKAGQFIPPGKENLEQNHS